MNRLLKKTKNIVHCFVLGCFFFISCQNLAWGAPSSATVVQIGQDGAVETLLRPKAPFRDDGAHKNCCQRHPWRTTFLIAGGVSIVGGVVVVGGLWFAGFIGAGAGVAYVASTIAPPKKPTEPAPTPPSQCPAGMDIIGTGVSCAPGQTSGTHNWGEPWKGSTEAFCRTGKWILCTDPNGAQGCPSGMQSGSIYNGNFREAFFRCNKENLRQLLPCQQKFVVCEGGYWQWCTDLRQQPPATKPPVPRGPVGDGCPSGMVRGARFFLETSSCATGDINRRWSCGPKVCLDGLWYWCKPEASGGQPGGGRPGGGGGGCNPEQPQPQPTIPPRPGEPNGACPFGMQDGGVLWQDGRSYPCDTPGHYETQPCGRTIGCGNDHLWHICQGMGGGRQPRPNPTQSPWPGPGDPAGSDHVIDMRTQQGCHHTQGQQCFQQWIRRQLGERQITEQITDFQYQGQTSCPSFISGAGTCWRTTQGEIIILPTGKLYQIYWQCKDRNIPNDYDVWQISACSTIPSSDLQVWANGAREWNGLFNDNGDWRTPKTVYIEIAHGRFRGSTILGRAGPTGHYRGHFNQIAKTGLAVMRPGVDIGTIVHEFWHVLTFSHLQQNLCGSEILRYFGVCLQMNGGHLAEGVRDRSGRLINVSPMQWYATPHSGIFKAVGLQLKDHGYPVAEQDFASWTQAALEQLGEGGRVSIEGDWESLLPINDQNDQRAPERPSCL